MKPITPKPQSPKDPVHYYWDFRREALLWEGESPDGVNFEPLALDMHRWMLRELHHLSAADELAKKDGYTNPYTYSGSTIRLALAHTINDLHKFAESDEPISPLDAEIRRIRFYNEQVIYTARFCEAAIKQLLYCTAVPIKDYEDAPLGGLLASVCKPCKGRGVNHLVSHFGSLAHRYFLCLEMDQCAEEHLRLAGRRRNDEAAHAQSQSVNPRTPKESRAHLMEDSVKVGKELTHLLGHIGELERRMNLELENVVTEQRGWPLHQLRFAIRSDPRRRRVHQNQAEACAAAPAAAATNPDVGAGSDET